MNGSTPSLPNSSTIVPSHKLPLIAWPLICVMVLSGCVRSGVDARRPDCPLPQLPPPSLMVEPQTESKVRAELFEPPQSATPR